MTTTGSKMKVAKLRMPPLIYDEYCRRALETGRPVQRMMYLELATKRTPGRPRLGRKSIMVDFKLPAALLRKYKKRARREGKPLSTLLRNILVQRVGGGDFAG